MNPKPGEVYLVDLGLLAKIRPAVVVSREDLNSPRALAVLVPLTTRYRRSKYEAHLGRLRFLRETSWANVQGIAAIGHEKLVQFLGLVGNTQMIGIRNALSYLLGL
jgi:mRNA interferase MazF